MVEVGVGATGGKATRVVELRSVRCVLVWQWLRYLVAQETYLHGDLERKRSSEERKMRTVECGVAARVGM